MNNHESPVEMLEEEGASEAKQDETAAEIVEITQTEVSPQRKQEIIDNAYRKIGNKAYTKAEWEERKNKIIQKAVAKGEVKPEPKPQNEEMPKSKPVPTQLEVAMARAKKNELVNILEGKSKTEKTPDPAVGERTLENTELLDIINNQTQPEKPLNPKEPKNKQDHLSQRNELLGTLDKVFEEGEKVMVSGESGVWQVVEYFSETGEYDLTNDNEISIHKFNAKKVYQTRSKMNSWLSKAGKSVKSWLGFGKGKKSSDKVFPKL